MAGTADDFNTASEWLLLSAARIHVIGYTRSQSAAERLLLNHLRGDGGSFVLRRRYHECIGHRGQFEPIPSSDQFWREYPQLGITVDIDWHASTARRRAPARSPSWPAVLGPEPDTDCTLHVVQVHRADLDAILQAIGLLAPPVRSSSPVPVLVDPKQWLTKAVVDHPRAGGESQSAYACRLQKIMATAPVTKQWSVKTIRRQLSRN
jgi:hypothetical protein